MRDLTHEPADVIAAERSRVATEGWGARLLALQAPDGLWGGRPWSQDWTDTFHVLELLRRFGLDPESEQARRAVGLVREHVTWRVPEFETPWSDNRFFEGEVEPCINGNVVATGAYFGVDMTPLVERLLGEQLPDGGWNCEVERGATVSSFGTTINVLEGLLEHERAIGGSAERGRGPPPRRGVHARAPAVPPEVDRRGDRSRAGSGSRSRPGASTTSCAGSTTCATPRSSPTSASPRRSRSSRAIEMPTAGGRSRTSTRARPTSRWTTARASRAAGTRSARCACSIGTRSAGRRRVRSSVRVRLTLDEPGEFLELTAEAALDRSRARRPMTIRRRSNRPSRTSGSTRVPSPSGSNVGARPAAEHNAAEPGGEASWTLDLEDLGGALHRTEVDDVRRADLIDGSRHLGDSRNAADPFTHALDVRPKREHILRRSRYKGR